MKTFIDILIIFGAPVLFIILYFLGFTLASLKEKSFNTFLQRFKNLKFFLIYILVLSLLTFWSFFSAIRLAIVCGVTTEAINEKQHYYLHRMSLWIPVCANVGVVARGEVPDKYIKLNLSPYHEFIYNEKAIERVKIMPKIYLLYFIFISLLPAYVLTYLSPSLFKKLFHNKHL